MVVSVSGCGSGEVTASSSDGVPAENVAETGDENAGCDTSNDKVDADKTSNENSVDTAESLADWDSVVPGSNAVNSGMIAVGNNGFFYTSLVDGVALRYYDYGADSSELIRDGYYTNLAFDEKNGVLYANKGDANDPISGPGAIVAIDINTKEETEFIDHPGYSIQFKDGKLYFVNNESKFIALDSATKNETVLIDKKVIAPIIAGDSVIYICPSEGEKVCCYDLASGESTILFDKRSATLVIGGNHAYVISNDRRGAGIYEVSLEGDNEPQLIYDGKTGDYLNVCDEKLWFSVDGRDNQKLLSYIDLADEEYTVETVDVAAKIHTMSYNGNNLGFCENLKVTNFVTFNVAKDYIYSLCELEDDGNEATRTVIYNSATGGIDFDMGDVAEKVALKEQAELASKSENSGGHTSSTGYTIVYPDGTVKDATKEETVAVVAQYNESTCKHALDILNQYRAEVGQPPLRWADELSGAAAIRAQEITVKFSHERPDGTKCFTAFPDLPVMGENILCGGLSAEETMNWWKNSPGHYANMIDSKYSGAYIDCVYIPDDPKHSYFYWVTLFD